MSSLTWICWKIFTFPDKVINISEVHVNTTTNIWEERVPCNWFLLFYVVIFNKKDNFDVYDNLFLISGAGFPLVLGSRLCWVCFCLLSPFEAVKIKNLYLHISTFLIYPGIYNEKYGNNSQFSFLLCKKAFFKHVQL